MSREWEYCRKLRGLEVAISRQRKFVGDLNAQGLDADGERKQLAELLAELDETLGASTAISTAA